MKYLKSFNESIDDELCKYLNADEYLYWKKKIVGIPHYKAINIIKKQIEIIESDFSKEYQESKFEIKRDRVIYNGNPLYGSRQGAGLPSSPELMMAVSYCGDDWYLVECYHNWHFYTFLCDDLVGLEELGQKVIYEIKRGRRVNEIKTFESNEDPLYYETGELNFDDRKEDDTLNLIDMIGKRLLSGFEVRKILPSMYRIEYKICRPDCPVCNVELKTNKIRRHSKETDFYVDIFELDDEYFDIEILDARDPKYDRDEFNQHYYRCDGVEGLLKFLKDEKIIK